MCINSFFTTTLYGTFNLVAGWCLIRLAGRTPRRVPGETSRWIVVPVVSDHHHTSGAKNNPSSVTKLVKLLVNPNGLTGGCVRDTSPPVELFPFCIQEEGLELDGERRLACLEDDRSSWRSSRLLFILDANGSRLVCSTEARVVGWARSRA